MATKRNAPTTLQPKAQPRSNAQRQADYRQRHLQSQDGQLQRLGLMVDHHAKLALQRLAKCYSVTHHHRALRALANRLVGILHGGLRHGVIYDEDTAWAHRIEKAA